MRRGLFYGDQNQVTIIYKSGDLYPLNEVTPPIMMSLELVRVINLLQAGLNVTSFVMIVFFFFVFVMSAFLFSCDFCRIYPTCFHSLIKNIKELEPRK